MIVGVDVGSQSLKAVVLDDRLQVRGAGRSGYPVAFPRPGWAEQDVHRWEAALGPAIADALDAAGCAPGAVAALGIAGQLDGCVPVDGDGRPLGPCLIWMDRRADAALAVVRARLSPEALRRRTGVNLDGTHMAAKMRWLLDHPPGGRAIAAFHQPVDYLVERLTGARAIDHGLASTTLVYDLAEGDFADDLLAAFGLRRELLPALRRGDEAAGGLSHVGSALTGLPQGMPVAVGTGDDFAAPLGGGVAEPGTVVNVLGTAEVVGALDPRPLIDSTGLVETHRFPGSGLYFIENPGWVSGGALEWLRGLLGIADVAAFDRLAAAAPAGSDGLVFLPALTGAMTPEWIAEARGCFYGLTPSHGPGHLARAVLEGTAYGLKDVTDRLRAMGVAVERVRLLGGGAKSALWARIRADATGLPVERARIADAAAVGAGMLAAVAGGRVADLAAAARLVGAVADTVAPDPANAAAYADSYDRYRRLFAALKPMFQASPPAS
jgi:xylulokinase